MSNDFISLTSGNTPVTPQPLVAAQRPVGKAAGLVTVLVACCGQLEYTRLCVPSLLRCSRPPFELFFLDSESLDGTSEYLEGLAAAAPVRVEVVRVQSEPGPAGVRKDEVLSIRGEYLALLNNDVLVTPGWLEGLTSLAASAADVGLVAPMSNYAPAAQLVDPVPYGIELGEAPRQGVFGAPVDKLYAFARQWHTEHRGQTFAAEALGGGCVLVKREALQKLGLFPTRTPLGTFDTDNLSQRVRQAGYRLLGCREVFVHNFGSRDLTR